jgi:hypothetical protein
MPPLLPCSHLHARLDLPCLPATPLCLPAALVTMSLGLASFSLAGLYCNHADLSPRYASVLLGMTNTSGALPGIVGVAFTGEVAEEHPCSMCLNNPGTLLMRCCFVLLCVCLGTRA